MELELSKFQAQYIRINDQQWPIYFRFVNGEASGVETIKKAVNRRLTPIHADISKASKEYQLNHNGKSVITVDYIPILGICFYL